MAEHTKGDWIIEGTNVFVLEHDDWHKGKERLRNRLAISLYGFGMPEEELQADVRLVAAAPELLAACIALCGIFEGQEDVPMYIQKARAAIAKASLP